MKHSDLELIRLQADALFVHDANGRLLRINESDPDSPAPRFFLSQTVTGNLWRFRADLPDDLAFELARLAAAEPVVSDLRQPPAHGAKYAELLERHGGTAEMESGPAYYLPPFDMPTTAVTITPENAALLEANFPYTLSKLDERTPVVVVVADGAAVAASYTVRTTPWVAEVGVHTDEAYRGRGYAVQTVCAWAAAIRASGRTPLYSTSWTNTASQAVAKKLGAVLYGVNFSLT